MKASVATVTITGIAPYSQSRQHYEPKKEGESHDDYDERTWRSKLTVEERDGKKTVVIPVHGMQQAIAAASKYSGKKIPGKGAKTWSKKFEAGIALFEAPALNIDPETVTSIRISANADGRRGSGTRVPRRFPEMHAWTSTFQIYVLDPEITREVFEEVMNLAGMFIGIGRFRPEKGGTNGRFRIDKLEWKDNRQLVEFKKAA